MLTSLNLRGQSHLFSGLFDPYNAALRCLPRSLTALDLGDCGRLTDDILSSLGQLVSLESLRLLGCFGYTDTGLSCLSNLSKLKVLSIGGGSGRDDDVDITDWGLATLGLPVLTHLTLRGPLMRVNAGGYGALARITTLKALTLWKCGSVCDDGGIAFAAAMPSLTLLRLVEHSLRDSVNELHRRRPDICVTYPCNWRVGPTYPIPRRRGVCKCMYVCVCSV